jgi:D-aminopeptidase
MARGFVSPVALLSVASFAAAQSTGSDTRPRASDLGLKMGVLPTGHFNAITDVPEVEVGQTTIIRGENIRTGVTAVLPHSGNLYREKMPGAVFVGNGFGKLTYILTSPGNEASKEGRGSEQDCACVFFQT